MIDEKQLKRVRVFQLVSGAEVIGFLQSKTLRGAHIELAAKIVTNYFFPDGQIRKNPIQGMFPYGVGVVEEPVFLRNHSIASESTPRPEVVEKWLQYAYPPQEENPSTEELASPDSLPNSGLELC